MKERHPIFYSELVYPIHKEKERAFYRYALRHLRLAFPILSGREQVNRLQRHSRDAIIAFSLFLAQHTNAQECLYEALDSSGIPIRDARAARQRLVGWLCRFTQLVKSSSQFTPNV